MTREPAGGFATAAGHYSRARPAYAREALGLIKESVAPGPILDLAAGTGILTGQLSRARREVIAAEPLAEMLAQLRRALPAVPAVSCVAEGLPFSDGVFAGVSVGQAFHWFDASEALSESVRVLRADGTLVMVFNERDESVSWVAELTDLIEARCGGRPYGGEREQTWLQVVAGTGAFGPPAVRYFDNPVASSPESLLERVRSTSFVAMMAAADRERLLAEVAALVERTPELAGRARFTYPHRTALYLWHRSG